MVENLALRTAHTPRLYLQGLERDADISYSPVLKDYNNFMKQMTPNNSRIHATCNRKIYSDRIIYVINYKHSTLQRRIPVYVTRFAKLRLIAGERNCSYSPFLSGTSVFVDFLFSSKTKI